MTELNHSWNPLMFECLWSKKWGSIVKPSVVQVNQALISENRERGYWGSCKGIVDKGIAYTLEPTSRNSKIELKYWWYSKKSLLTINIMTFDCISRSITATDFVNLFVWW